MPDLLHVAAQGKRPSAYGWLCKYADDTDIPLEELVTPAYSFY